MSVTTLEEVFLRVANGTADVTDRKKLASINLQRQSSQSSSIMDRADTVKVAVCGGVAGVVDPSTDSRYGFPRVRVQYLRLGEARVSRLKLVRSGG